VTLEALILATFAAVGPHAFAVAKAANPGLQAYDGPAAVTDVLRASGAAAEEKLAVARALVAGLRAGPRPLYAALLLRGLEHPLRRLRSELRGLPLAPDDLDQLVVTRFVAEASAVKPRTAEGMMLITRLVERTRKKVWIEANDAAAYEERRIEGLVPDPSRPPDPNDDSAFNEVWDLLLANPSHKPDDDAPWRHMRAKDLADGLGNTLTPRTRAVLDIVATMPDPTLLDYVDRTAEGTRQQRRLKYFRLKKEEALARAELRRVLGQDEDADDDEEEAA
jgi:hypothetical protein